MSRIDSIKPAQGGTVHDQREQSDGNDSSEESADSNGKPDSASGHSDRDSLEASRSSKALGSPNQAAGVGLEPVGEVTDRAGQAAALAKRLQELEGAFQFMGTGHPLYAQHKKAIDELKALLKSLAEG